MFQTAFVIKKFQTVPIEWQMTCCDHAGSVISGFRINNRHKHGRCGGHAAVRHIDAFVKHAADCLFFNFRTGDSGISADTYNTFFRGNIFFL